MAIYKDCFWMPDIDGRGMIHDIPLGQLRGLGVELYKAKGGSDVKTFSERGKRF